MTEVGEFEFTVQDEWGQGIPITDSMAGVITAGLATFSVMALLKDLLEEVLE